MVRFHHQMGRLLRGHHVCSKATCTQMVLHSWQLCTVPSLRYLQPALPCATSCSGQAPCREEPLQA